MAQNIKPDPGSLNKLRTVNPRLISYNVEMTEVTGGTDIVIVGGLLSSLSLLISSFLGLLIKAPGIDGIIGLIRKFLRRNAPSQA